MQWTKILSAGPMLRDYPTFSASSRLARYIDPEFRRTRNKRPQPGAYQKLEDDDYLSVNSTEVKTLGQIADTYAKKFEKGQRPVAIACPTVEQYNAAANGVGLTITYNDGAEAWEFGGAIRAYKHWPKTGNESHCGVEYVRIFRGRQDLNFAVRMGNAVTYKDV